MTDQLFTGPHSTWQGEVRALKARVATLEEAIERLIETAEQCDLPEWAGFHLDQARAALEAKT